MAIQEDSTTSITVMEGLLLINRLSTRQMSLMPRWILESKDANRLQQNLSMKNQLKFEMAITIHCKYIHRLCNIVSVLMN